MMYPKPEPRKTVKARQRRAHQQLRDACLLEVFERAGGRCEMCGCPVLHKHDPRATEWSVMHGHETVRRSQGGSPRDPANVRALCLTCHMRIHGRG